MTLILLHDNVLIKRAKPETHKGGVLIPESMRKLDCEGVVFAVGKGKATKKGNIAPFGLNIGDYVAFGAWAGNEIVIDGEKLLLMKADDVLAVRED